MKKKILFVAFLGLLSISSVSAQNAWGIRAGLCYSTATGEGESLSGAPSLEIGPTVYRSLKNNFYLNSGLMLSVKRFDADYGAGYDKETGQAYFLELPLYAGYAFSLGGIDFYAQAGPFVGFKVADDNLAGMKSFNAGLGAAYGININRFKIELGYQQGLISIVDEAEVTLGSAFLGISYVF